MPGEIGQLNRCRAGGKAHDRSAIVRQLRQELTTVQSLLLVKTPHAAEILPCELDWQAERGITSFFMHDVRELGIGEVVDRSVAGLGEGPVFLTVDVDVLDPAYAPGTGTPEPGGMSSVDLLWAVRSVAERLELVGLDVVEVIPTAVGSADVTALVAERVVREALTGIALRRRALGGS